MPRPYRLGKRRAAADQTRARVIAAARELMTSANGFVDFTIGAVARQAGVAPMTVYYQFGSKHGLLEAVFDELAARGGMEGMAAVFTLADPLAGLDELIAVFDRFWASDRLVLRRFRALAALDPELEPVVRGRDEWRRSACRAILDRLSERYGRPQAAARDEAVEVLHTITSFETFDTLAGAAQDPTTVAPLLQRLARAFLGLPER
jgi:AcrR family transcriptional regulator